MRKGQIVVFHFEYCADGKTWIEGAHDYKCIAILSGLTAGTTYSFRYRLWMNGAFTDYATQIVTLLVK